VLLNRKQRRAATKLKPASSNLSPPQAASAIAAGGTTDLLSAARKLHQAGKLTEAEAFYRRVLALQPSHADALNLLGVVAHQMGRHEQAVEAIRQAIQQNGQNAGYFSNLGNVLYGQGKLDEAIAAYRQAIGIKPDFADAYSNLGVGLKDQGKLDDAVAAHRRAISIKPDFAAAHENLGAALQEQGKLDEAVTAYRQAIRIKPDDAKAFHNLGIVLAEQGKLDEAVAAIRRAIGIKPDFAEAYYHLGAALNEQGKLDESRGVLETASELAPRSAVTHRVLGDAKRFCANDPQLATMEKLARDVESLSPDEQIELHFALAKAYDDLGDHGRSASHLLKGNALKRQRINYNEAATQELFRRLQHVFTADLMRNKQNLGDPSKLPVFIIGMPRSGTTLIEQILASHPEVFGAGELDDIGKAVAKLRGQDDASVCFPEVTSSWADEQLRLFGTTYVSAVRALAPKAERIVDKMPKNFLFAGLIHLALPNARIIHARRDPLDTCLSCFSKLFAERHPYSYDLAELGRYYRGYAMLMQHWRKVLSPGVLLEVQYETLTADLAGEARRLVAHCGLDWDDACLSFHNTERPVRTASAVQVRQPIYRSSVGRSRPYAQLLGPLIEALALDGGS
jgi:tetratricopeptide (TPR) repeat protein